MLYKDNSGNAPTCNVTFGRTGRPATQVSRMQPKGLTVRGYIYQYYAAGISSGSAICCSLSIALKRAHVFKPPILRTITPVVRAYQRSTCLENRYAVVSCEILDYRQIGRGRIIVIYL
jgi:galactokinase